ncbi:hypothetical protein [Phytohabitans houttuyneae]|uniref:hypothetical protein n=1 Tax=Phytohabitans houttuyneae TaxID=1076126 RepID=UPI00280AA5B8|nr:hypothetical protein [Phytohabitans houttuyneae]
MRQKLSRVFGGIAIAALVFGGAACQAGEDDGEDGGGNAACGQKIAFFGPLTGDAAGLGIHIRNGAKLAIDQYNKENADCTAELAEFDSQGDPAKALPWPRRRSATRRSSRWSARRSRVSPRSPTRSSSPATCRPSPPRRPARA